jgi:flagellar FliJ protein
MRGAAVSALDSLIRLHRWQVAERRRHLADLEGLAAQFTDEHHRLAHEETHEQAAAAASPEAAVSYAAYARQLSERRRKLAQSQAEVAEQIERSRTALAEAFQEVKRYEIMAANRMRQQQRREVRRQQQALDGRGAEGFRRRGAGKD